MSLADLKHSLRKYEFPASAKEALIRIGTLKIIYLGSILDLRRHSGRLFLFSVSVFTDNLFPTCFRTNISKPRGSFEQTT